MRKSRCGVRCRYHVSYTATMDNVWILVFIRYTWSCDWHIHRSVPRVCWSGTGHLTLRGNLQYPDLFQNWLLSYWYLDTSWRILVGLYKGELLQRTPGHHPSVATFDQIYFVWQWKWVISNVVTTSQQRYLATYNVAATLFGNIQRCSNVIWQISPHCRSKLWQRSRNFPGLRIRAILFKYNVWSKIFYQERKSVSTWWTFSWDIRVLEGCFHRIYMKNSFLKHFAWNALWFC